MRPHGRATIDMGKPSALGICDRCGFRFNHYELLWEYQWQGPRIQNRRFLVCQSCWDKPQEQLRTIVLPPDPVPIMNARPENNVSDNNPMSGIGVSPNFFTPEQGSRIGSLTAAGGLNAAFDGNINKPTFMSACNTISKSSYDNWVGMNWGGNNTTLNLPSSMSYPVIRHSLLSFTAYSPNDRGFLGSVQTDWVVQSSPATPAPYGAWTTISSGTTSGAPGDVISAQCTGGLYQFHRIAFLGDQVNFVSIAQVQFNVAQIGEVVTQGSS